MLDSRSRLYMVALSPRAKLTRASPPMRSRLHSWVDERGEWVGNGGNAEVRNSRFEMQMLPNGRAC